MVGRNLGRASRWLLRTGIAVAVGIALLYLLRGLWLPQIGYALVGGGQVGERAEAIVVPGADWVGSPGIMDSLNEAARLLQEGRGVMVFMTCPEYYGVSGCQLAEEALASSGRQVKIHPLPTERLPDGEEAAVVMARLAGLQVTKAIVVLPSYKTGRLKPVYEQEGARRGLRVTTVGATVGEFDPGNWWRLREGRKVVAYELLRWLRLL